MNVIPLAVPFMLNGIENFFYPVLLRSETEKILVDAGYEGFYPRINQSLEKLDLTARDITGIIITHHDIDHLGGAYEWKAAHPSLRIYCYESEKPYVEGSIKSLRLQQAEDLFPTLPEIDRSRAIDFQKRLAGIKPVQVDAVFTDNEEPAFLPGIRILHTPGHMPGHISLYDTESQTLVSADALILENGLLNLANPRFTLNKNEALKTVQRLSRLSLKRIICFHGGIMDENIPGQLRSLLERYRATANKKL